MEFIRIAALSHVIEPKHPGAVESVIDTTSCWDADALHGCREEIIALSKACSRCHQQCCQFLSAAASLMNDTHHLALEAVRTDKLEGYCRRMAEREFRPVRKAPGQDRVRFLNAVTNQGCVCFVETAKLLADRIYLINDDHGAVSRLMLHSIRSKALAAGYDTISCYCPLSPCEKLEHLLIPQLSIALVTSNRFHDLSQSVDPWRIVNNQRFSDNDKLKSGKRRILFNRKAAVQMTGQAEALLKDAKAIHDELESYYIHATDFSKVDALTERTLAKVEAMR